MVAKGHRTPSPDERWHGADRSCYRLLQAECKEEMGGFDADRMCEGVGGWDIYRVEIRER